VAGGVGGDKAAWRPRSPGRRRPRRGPRSYLAEPASVPGPGARLAEPLPTGSASC